jgi:methylthioribulose-1-phosphate dehydratase
MSASFNEATQQIISAGQRLYLHGLVPATSGNFSNRLQSGHIAVTVSGKSKGQMSAADVMEIDAQGQPITVGKKASAEALLHTAIYKTHPQVNAILHTHSVNATVFTRLIQDKIWRLYGYEIQKAFPEINTHEMELNIPIFDNTQNIAALAALTEEYLTKHPNVPGYLIRGHGAYTWGRTMEEALKHVEAFEFLLSCEIELARCKA